VKVSHTIRFRFLDVFHSSEYILVGFFVFGFLGPQLLFGSEVFLLILLHLGQGGIVGKPPVFKLLSCSLEKLVAVDVFTKVRESVPDIPSSLPRIAPLIQAIPM
jgi:hypothetical protein